MQVVFKSNFKIFFLIEKVKKSGWSFITIDKVDVFKNLIPKADIALAVFGTTLERFSARSRQAYSGQQMLEEYVSFYQSL